MLQNDPVHCFVASPLGQLRLVAVAEGLLAVYFSEHKRARYEQTREAPGHVVLELARRELTEYFAANRRHFVTPLAPYELRRATDFQRLVWEALLAIPFGERRSYAEVARSIGRPSAVRAVGAANGLNPLSIFVPCHRVVGSDGALTGYAGGVDGKRWLLAHESESSQ